MSERCNLCCGGTGEYRCPACTEIDLERQVRELRAYAENVVAAANNVIEECQRRSADVEQGRARAITVPWLDLNVLRQTIAMKPGADRAQVLFDQECADTVALEAQPECVHETCTKPNETREGRWDYDDQDRTFYHTDFSTDAMLKLDGDWASVDQRITFAARVLKALAGEFCHQSCNNTAALTAAFGLLRRVRDRVDTVQFFEANAVMGLIEEALRDTASTAHSGAMDTTAGTSSPAAVGAAPASLTENWHAIEGPNGQCACGPEKGGCGDRLRALFAHQVFRKEGDRIVVAPGALREWPHIAAILAGTVAGDFRDWPKVRAELLDFIRVHQCGDSQFVACTKQEGTK